MKKYTLNSAFNLNHFTLNVLSLSSAFSNVSHILHFEMMTNILIVVLIIVLCRIPPFSNIIHELHIGNFAVHITLMYVEPITMAIILSTISELLLLLSQHFHHYPKHYQYIKNNKRHISWLMLIFFAQTL